MYCHAFCAAVMPNFCLVRHFYFCLLHLYSANDYHCIPLHIPVEQKQLLYWNQVNSIAQNVPHVLLFYTKYTTGNQIDIR